MKTTTDVLAGLAEPVAFAEDYPARCEALVARLVQRRAGREGSGRSSLLGPGGDFAGHRPYRPGEDLRRLDWDLLARLDRPFVRVERRDAGERWTIWLDRSASMGIGAPHKLQRGAECAAGLARIGLALGARVRVVLSPGANDAPRAHEVQRSSAWGGLLAFLRGTRAEGDAGLATLWTTERPLGDRLFGIGDFLDGEARGWFVHQRRGRRIAGVQILAPSEFAPGLGGVAFVDPERGERLELEIDAQLLGAYERRLEEQLHAWRSAAARHAAQHVVGTSARPFEEHITQLLES